MKENKPENKPENKRKWKLLNFFNKRNNKNTGKKRLILASALLTWKLIFGDFRGTQNYSTSLTHEKVISNQELNSLEDYQNSGTIIRTGNGTILEFQQEVSDLNSNEILSEYTLNETNEVILVKDDGILPGAEGFRPQHGSRRHPFGHPKIRPQEHLQLPPQNKVGETDTGLDAKRGNRGDQCPASEELDIKKELKMFKEDMNKKDIKVKCDLQRFTALSTNPQTGKIDKKSLIEAKAGLQAEGEGIVSNLKRPTNPAVDLDFQATDTSTGEEIFMDLKTPIDFKTVGPDRGRFPSYRKVGYDMGKKLTEQKLKHLGLPQGPKSENEVLHVIDLDQIDPSEKETIIREVFKGAKEAGCTCLDKIKFINSK